MFRYLFFEEFVFHFVQVFPVLFFGKIHALSYLQNKEFIDNGSI